MSSSYDPGNVRNIHLELKGYELEIQNHYTKAAKLYKHISNNGMNDEQVLKDFAIC